MRGGWYKSEIYSKARGESKTFLSPLQLSIMREQHNFLLVRNKKNLISDFVEKNLSIQSRAISNTTDAQWSLWLKERLYMQEWNTR